MLVSIEEGGILGRFEHEVINNEAGHVHLCYTCVGLGFARSCLFFLQSLARCSSNLIFLTLQDSQILFSVEAVVRLSVWTAMFWFLARDSVEARGL